MVTSFLSSGLTYAATGTPTNPIPSPNSSRTGVLVCNTSGTDLIISVNGKTIYVVGPNDTKVIPIGANVFTVTGSGNSNYWEVIHN